MTSPERERLTPAELAVALGGELAVDGDAPVGRLASLTSCVAGEAADDAVVVAATAADLARLAAADIAPAVVVTAAGVPVPRPLAAVARVVVVDARLALARLTALLDTRPSLGTGRRHAAAVVDPGATLGDGVTLGPGAVVGAGAVLGARVYLGANAVVGAGSEVGDDCVLHANVTVYDGVRLGARVVLHSGCVVGADGFGYAASPTGAVKVRHLGGVTIADDVEVGANTAIDRGTLDDTVIGPRTKIDNHCQVGHNVRIGADCLVAGMTGIAGSATLGDRVVLGGAVAVADHVTIGTGARVAGRSGVTKDVPEGETWAGFPARPYRRFVRGLYLKDRLEELWAAHRSARDEP